MSDISGLASKSELATVENKKPDVRSLVTKKTITKKSVKLKAKLIIIITTI